MKFKICTDILTTEEENTPDFRNVQGIGIVMKYTMSNRSRMLIFNKMQLISMSVWTLEIKYGFIKNLMNLVF